MLQPDPVWLCGEGERRNSSAAQGYGSRAGNSTGRYRSSIRSSLDGSSVQCVVVGEAMDSGDKATNKALSIAYKYMAFQLFSIPIADDPDRTTHQLAPSVKTVGAGELSAIRTLAEQAGVTEEYINSIYKIEALEFLPLAKAPEVMTNLQKKVKSKTKEKEAS